MQINLMSATEVNQNTWIGDFEGYTKLTEALKKIETKAFSEEELKAISIAKQTYGYYEDDDEGDDDDKVEDHWMAYQEDDVWVVNVKGPMHSGRAGFWGYIFGFCGYDDIKDAILIGLDKGFTSFLLDWDTPGGSVRGVEEASQFLKDLNNSYTCCSFTSTSVMSAGLWLATVMDDFYATKMSQIGSVGAFQVLEEHSEFFKMAGTTHTLIRSAPFKGIGNPYEKLSQEAKAKFQEDVMIAHGFFVDAISENCGLPKDFVTTNIATGEWWYASKALDLGLISEIMDYSDVILSLREDAAAKERPDTYHAYQQSKQLEDSSMKRKVLTQTISEKAAAAIASGVPAAVAMKDEPVIETEVEATDDKETAESKEKPNNTTVVATKDPDPDPVAAKQQGFDISSLMAQLVDTKVALATALDKLAKAESGVDNMKSVVVQAIQRANVGAGGAAPDTAVLMAMDSTVLVAQYNQIDAVLAKRFGLGKQMSVSVDETDEEDSTIKQLTDLQEDLMLDLAKL